MTDGDDLLRRLHSLRDQVNELVAKPRFCQAFQVWHRRVIEAATQCGEGAVSELKAFRAIDFEVPPELLEQHRKNLESLSEGDGRVTDSAKPQLSNRSPITEDLEKQHYRRKLYEAQELITAIIYVRKGAK